LFSCSLISCMCIFFCSAEIFIGGAKGPTDKVSLSY
jgi:hypothetical protein